MDVIAKTAQELEAEDAQVAETATEGVKRVEAKFARMTTGGLGRDDTQVAKMKTVEPERGNVLYLPLEPAGYPISPDSLDFGSGNPTPTQINNASRFSQLMNQIPNAGQKVWTASGRVVWNIWDIVLDSVQFPEGVSANTLLKLKANFEIDRRSNMFGEIYYRTGYSPQGFWKSTFDSQWKSCSFSPDAATRTDDVMSLSTATAKARKLEFDTRGLRFSADMILVTLLRSWWYPWLFNSNNWRYAPGSIGTPLSDGLTPPTGSMAMYANAFLVARNVNLGLDMSRPKNAALPAHIEQADALVWSQFQMKGSSHDTSLIASEADLKLTKDGLHSSGLQIIGFSCNVLPKCPNPNPNQQWP